VRLGVDKEFDIHYIAEADLTDVVKPVHARKLIAYWRKARYVVILVISNLSNCLHTFTLMYILYVVVCTLQYILISVVIFCI